MSTAQPLVGILLAAGQGRRFGFDKLLQPMSDGVPMAVICARKLLAVCTQCFSVLRPEQIHLAELLTKQGMQIVFAPEAEQGMGHSLAAGVRANAEANGWLIALADMPFIQTQTIALVAGGLRKASHIVAPVYGQRRGHPVAFGPTYGPELSVLVGDHGARDLIRRHEQQLISIDCDDPGVLQDIDRQADLANSHHQRTGKA